MLTDMLTFTHTLAHFRHTLTLIQHAQIYSHRHTHMFMLIDTQAHRHIHSLTHALTQIHSLTDTHSHSQPHIQNPHSDTHIHFKQLVNTKDDIIANAKEIRPHLTY